jgi:GNAT superfamily N-acetyltransferase
MRKKNCSISTDKSQLQPEVIHAFLTDSYWAKGITLERVEKRIKHSLCFGVYLDNQQVGFARLITDYDSFAYLADVFILENHRGKGLSKQLMTFILAHLEVQGLRRWLLATRDAHGLYAQFEFTPISIPERWMERFDENSMSN